MAFPCPSPSTKRGTASSCSSSTLTHCTSCLTRSHHPQEAGVESSSLTLSLMCRRAIARVPDPGELYSKLMNIIVDLALAGLIHGDFNEFNILVKRKTYEPVVIDFPQMVSVRHENAE